MKICPLCQHRFNGRIACRNCGLVKSCLLLKCPNCSYEFVEESRTLSFFERIFPRLRKEKGEREKECLPSGHDLQEGAVALSEIPLGKPYRLAFIIPKNDHRLRRLAVYGVVPGTEVRVSQRKPTTVLRVGETDLAIDDEVARDIYVRET